MPVACPANEILSCRELSLSNSAGFRAGRALGHVFFVLGFCSSHLGALLTLFLVGRVPLLKEATEKRVPLF